MAIDKNDAGTPMITPENVDAATRHELRKYARHNSIAVKDQKHATLLAAVKSSFDAPAPEPVAENDAAARIAELEAQLADLTAKAKRQDVKPAKGVSGTMLLRAARTLAAAENGEYDCEIDGDSLTLNADILIATGWSNAYCHLSNGWGKTKPAGMAFAAQGWQYTGRTVLDGDVLETGKGLRKPHLVHLRRIEAPSTGE